MARRNSIELRSRLTTLLPSRTIWRLARESGFVQRVRKVSPPAFLWTLVFGFSFGDQRTLAGLRRAYEVATRTSLAPSAFSDRFDASLVRFLKAVVELVLGRLVEPSRALAGELVAFAEVLVADTTVIRLDDSLAGAFPGCRTNYAQAALKLHALMTVNGSGPRSVKVTSERKPDGKVLRVGKWVKDRLLLFDLGYYRYQLFDCIRRNGGYFVTRLKKNANPTIVAVHRRWPGASIPLVGEKLQDVIGRLQRQEIDVEVEVKFQRRRYAGKRSTARERLRLVGLRNEETGEYHLYATNVPVELFSAKGIAALYRARWTIELLFKSLKSDFRLDQMPSSNEHVVRALVYASILTWVASRELLVAARKVLAKDGRSVPQRRWTRLLRTCAPHLLLIVTAPPRHAGSLTRSVEFALLTEGPDPHRKRKSLGVEVELGMPLSRRSAQASRSRQAKCSFANR